MTFVTKVKGSLSKTKIVLFTKRKENRTMNLWWTWLDWLDSFFISHLFLREQISGYGNSSLAFQVY